MATTRIRGQQLNLTGSALLDRGITMTALKGISAAGPTNITFGANDIGLTGSIKLTKTTPTANNEVASKAYVDSSTGGSIPKGTVSFGQYDGSGFDGDPNLGTFRLNSTVTGDNLMRVANLTQPSLFFAASGSSGLSNLSSGSIRLDVGRIALTGSVAPASGSGVDIKASNASGYVSIAGGASGYVNVEGLKVTDTNIDAASGDIAIEAAAGTIGIGVDPVAEAINIGTGAAARTIAVGNETGATALDLDAGTGGVTIDSQGAGTIAIGTETDTGAINIGIGASARTITVGNDASTKVDVNAQAIELDSAGTVVLDSTTSTVIGATTTMTLSGSAVDVDAGSGALSLNANQGAINVGNDADTGAINVGTGAAARTVTIGNATGATGVVIDVGTGHLSLGASATAHETTLGGTTGDSGVTIQAGTGGVDVNAGAAISLDASAGNVNLTSTAGEAALQGQTLDIDATSGAFNMAGTAASTVVTSGGALNLDGKTGVNIKEDGTAVIEVTTDRAVNLSVSGQATTVKGTFNVDEAASFDSTVTIAGNLLVKGTQTSVSSSNLTIKDPIVTLGMASSSLGGAMVPGPRGDRGFAFMELGAYAGSPVFYWDTSGAASSGVPQGTFRLGYAVTSGSTDSITPAGYLDTTLGNLYPGGDDAYDLGSASAAWQDLHLEGDIKAQDAMEIDTAAGAITIDGKEGVTLQEDGTAVLTIDTSKNLTVANAAAIDIDGSGAVSIDSSVGSMTMGAILADGQTLTLGPASATQMVFTPHGTAGSEKISITNTSGDAADAVKIHSDAGGVQILADSTTHGVAIATATSAVPVTIGHTTSKVAIGQHLSVAGDLQVTGSGGIITTAGNIQAANIISGSFMSGTWGASFGSGWNGTAPAIFIGRTATAGQARIEAAADFTSGGTSVLGLSPTSVQSLVPMGVTGTLAVAGTLAVVGGVTQAGGVISMNGSAASSISTAVGNLTLDSAATLNLGTAVATGITLGRASSTISVESGALFQGGSATQFSMPDFTTNRVQGAYAGAASTAMTNPEGDATAQIIGSTAIHVSGSPNAIYKGGSEMVYLNGLLLLSGAGNDYHVTSSATGGPGQKMRTITLSSPLISGDVVQVKFVKFYA